MRYAAGLALALVACTSPATQPRPTPAAPTAEAAPRTLKPLRLRYRSELTPKATRTLVAAGGHAFLLDDTGRVLDKRWLPFGTSMTFAVGNGTTYAVADSSLENEVPDVRLYRYDSGRFTELERSRVAYPDRFASGGRTYHYEVTEEYDDYLADDRGHRWFMEDVDPLRPNTGGVIGMGRDPGPGWVAQVVTTKTGPIRVNVLDGRCTVTHAGEGRQIVLDAPEPWRWQLCGASAVDTDGRLAILAADAGGDAGTRDRLVLIHVDPGTFEVERRVLFTRTWWANPAGDLVALSGGLAAFGRDLDGFYVADLRPGSKAVRHAVDLGWSSEDYGFEVAAADADHLFVWGNGTTVARVDVRTGRVERNALRLPYYVSSVVRVR